MYKLLATLLLTLTACSVDIGNTDKAIDRRCSTTAERQLMDYQECVHMWVEIQAEKEADE